MRHSLKRAAVALGALAAWTSAVAEPAGGVPRYLYLWTASADKSQPDFLAVLDVTEADGRYQTWPHGGNARGIPHGAVFSVP